MTTAMPLPAHTIENEQAVLGIAMNVPGVLPRIRQMLTLNDFYQPRHQKIYAAMLDLADAGVETDPIRVAGAITEMGAIRDIGGLAYLHTLYATSAVAGNLDYYATKVRDATRVRELERVITSLAQARMEMVDDMDGLLTHTAREALALDLLVDGSAIDQPIEGLHTVSQFVSIPDRPEDFIVPGFLEAQDVWMLLGSEGSGKSWLSRQLTECIAAGIHPLRPSQRIEPRRTLLVDLENAAPQVRRQTRPLLHQVLRLADHFDPDMAWIWHYPAGLNLRKHADAQLFERVVAEVRPDFVALGSLYKAFTRGRDDWDTAADEVRVVFDRIRARYGVAYWLEHHMPKGTGKDRPELPFGSSVWQRWAGFGRVLKRVGRNTYELKPAFRGDRDHREFPVGLARGGELPWDSVWDVEELDQGRDKAFEE